MSGPLLIEASSLATERDARIALIIRDVLVAALVGVARPRWILLSLRLSRLADPPRGVNVYFQTSRHSR